MVFGLPAIGETSWGQKILDSINAVKATADAAQTAAGLDAAVAAKVDDTGTDTGAALSETFGIAWAPKPSGGDDTAALQAAMLTAQSTTGTLRLHPGTYRVTTLATSQSFQQPRIIGAGIDRTTILFTANNGKLRMRGGAAGVSGGGVEHLTIAADTGITGTIGLELASACFTSSRQVKFDSSLSVGVLFHNDTPGDFTEHNILNECQFTTTTGVAVEWRVTAGNQSFHGSGLRDCQVSMSGTTAPFKIGAGAYVYNAPLDASVYLGDNTGAVVFNTSSATKNILTHGSLRFEGPTVVRDLHNGLSVFWDHAGTLSGLTLEYVRTNPIGSSRLAVVSSASHNADGSSSRAVVNQNTRFNLTTGSNETIRLDGQTCLAWVWVSGPNYEYEYLLSVVNFPGASTGNVAILDTARVFDSAGYGAPTLSVSNYALTITNASYPASGVTAYIARVDMRNRNAI